MRLALALLFLAASAAAQSTRPADPWQRLASPDFAEREKATDELWRQGEAVRERLTKEIDTGSADKRDRCRRLLWLLDLGVTPAMPADAVETAAGYSYLAEQSDKIARLVRLQPLARAGSPVLLKLALNEPDPDVRATAFNYSYPKATDTFLSAVADAPAGGASPDGERLIAYARAFAHVRVDANVRLLDAAVLGLHGRLPAEIDRLTAMPNRSRDDTTRLARLLVAAGRDDEAVRLDADRPRTDGDLRDVQVAALVRRGDPAALRAALQGRLAGAPNEDDPAVAFCLAREGRADLHDALLKTWPDTQDASNDFARRRTARRLLLAGAPDAAAAMFAKLPDGVSVLGRMGRWVEAFSIDDPPADSPQRDAYDRAVLQLKEEAGLRPPTPPGRRDSPVPTTPPPTAPPTTETATAGPTLAAAFARAAVAYKAGRFADAIAECDGPLAAGPRTAVVGFDTGTGGFGVGGLAPAARVLRAECLAALHDPAAEHARLDAALRFSARADVWLDVIDQLDDAGLTALADAQAERLDRCCIDNPWAVSTLAVRNARRYAAAKDWAAAARAQDRLLLTHLTTPTLQYTDPAGYVRGPYLANAYHARAALAAGDKSSAIAYANTAVVYSPTNASVVIDVVPKLQAAARAESRAATDAAADALFDTAWAKQTELCRDYPKAARLRNTAAWTALRCDRRLDAALKLAEESVALAPGNPASLDTLAEALFRAGRRDEAVARMREAVAIAPDEPSAKQRLAGFERGEIVLPDEAD